MSKRRVIGLVVGWLAAGFALGFVVELLHFSWTFFTWSPQADVLSVSTLSGMLALLAGIWFLAKLTRDRVSQAASALVCLVLAESATRAASWFPLLIPVNADSARQWFERACSLVLFLPVGFWLWKLWLPDVSRAARNRIIATAACTLVFACAAINVWVHHWVHPALAQITITANTPKSKDLGDVVAEAFRDALMKGGPAPKPDPEAWQRIRVGLSREVVLAILGQPATKMKPNPPASAETRSNFSHEWWEYGYSSPIGTSAVDPRAYAIFFDHTDRVTSFQVPSETSK